MPQVVDRLRALLDGVGPPVLGIGLSLPGTLDPVRGLSIGSPVMSGWDGVELAPYFADLADAPLFVANDADVLARSELLGGAGALDDVLVVKASTGLGLGHHRRRPGAQRPPRCGRRDRAHHRRRRRRACRAGAAPPGASRRSPAGWALVARMAEAGQPVEHVRDLVALALQGDSFARGLLRDSGRELGEVLAVAINLLNPAAVVIGGDMAAAFDFYVAGVRESVYRASGAAGHPRPAVPARDPRRPGRGRRLRRARPRPRAEPGRRGRPARRGVSVDGPGGSRPGR